MIWKQIPGWPYEASDHGDIRRQGSSNCLAQQFCSRNGYFYVGMQNGRKVRRRASVHRLVIEAFVGEIPPGYVVNHLDCNKLNNSVTNLEITTPAKNVQHARASGRYRNQRYGELIHNSKIDNEMAERLRGWRYLGFRYTDLAKIFGLNKSTVYGAVMRNRATIAAARPARQYTSSGKYRACPQGGKK